MKIIKGQCEKDILQHDIKLSKNYKFLNGKQIAWMMRQKFKVDIADSEPHMQREFVALFLKKDNLPTLLSTWDSISSECTNLADNTFECLFATQLEHSTQFKGDFEQYEIASQGGEEQKSYVKLRQVVDNCLKIKESPKCE